MGLAPLVRAASSSLSLRYRGTVSSGVLANAYPIDPGTYPSNSDASGSVGQQWVRFSLCDLWSDDRTPQTELPSWVYDDGQFASQSPHRTVACLASSTPGINTTDLSINTKTWAQNIDIVSRTIDSLVLGADTGVSINNDPANGAMILLDQGASSGLGFNSGLPVIAVRFLVLATEGQLTDFDVDVTITIRHSAVR